MTRLFDRLKKRQESKRLSRQQESIFFILAAHPDLSEADLVELRKTAEQCRERTAAIAAVVTHPKAPPKLWRELLLRDDLSADRTFWACVDIERIRRNLLVRSRTGERVLERQHYSKLILLITDADPADCARLFRSLPRNGPYAAANILAEHGGAFAHYPTREDLATFPTFPGQSERLAAITCLDMFMKDREVQAPSPALKQA